MRSSIFALEATGTNPHSTTHQLGQAVAHLLTSDKLNYSMTCAKLRHCSTDNPTEATAAGVWPGPTTCTPLPALPSSPSGVLLAPPPDHRLSAAVQRSHIFSKVGDSHQNNHSSKLVRKVGISIVRGVEVVPSPDGL